MARAHKPRNEVELPVDFVMKPLEELPKAVDWRDQNVVTSVKDQVCCTAAFARWGSLIDALAVFRGTADLVGHLRVLLLWRATSP